MVSMNFGDTKFSKKINLYNSYKKSVKINLFEANPDFANFLLEICERIIACYCKQNPSHFA